MYLPLKRSFDAHTMDSVRERSSLRSGLCYIFLNLVDQSCMTQQLVTREQGGPYEDAYLDLLVRFYAV